MSLSYNPTLFNAAANKAFLQGAMEVAGQSYAPMIASVVTSTRNQEVYGSIGPPPGMSKFKGEVHFNPVLDASITVKNEKYVAGFQVSNDAFEDDQLQGFTQVLANMGREAVLLPNRLLMQALIDATGVAGVIAGGYDGVSLLNDAHPARGAAPAQDNLLAGAGTTVANIKSDLNGKVIAGLRGFMTEAGTGYYYNQSITEIAICYPPAIREAMIEAINAGIIANTSNVSLSAINFWLIEDPQLEDADANDWYAINVSASPRPLILQQRLAFQLVAEVPNTGSEFVAEVKRWKSRWRGAIAPGPWHNIVKVVNT